MTKTPSGEDIVILSRSEYDALVAQREDLDDAAAAREVLSRVGRGTETVLSDEEVDALLAAPTPLAFWRRRRGLTQTKLAGAVGIAQGFLSEMETGKKTGDVATLRNIARVLGVTIDDLAAD
jgi:DNA-binding XRE family transcriptional regulator